MVEHLVKVPFAIEATVEVGLVDIYVAKKIVETKQEVHLKALAKVDYDFDERSKIEENI